MLYQVIDGNLIPIMYVLNQRTRSIDLTLSSAGSDVTVTVALTDLSENLITIDDAIVINVIEQCMWVPQLIINNGSGKAESRDLTVTLTAEPDGINPDVIPPLMYAFLSTDKEALEALRDQHVAIPGSPEYNDRPLPHTAWSGLERWYNSKEWYMTFDDIDFVRFTAPGPDLKSIPPDVWMEYIAQPQVDWWLRENFDHSTIARIDNTMSGYVPVLWKLGATEYFTNIGNDVTIYGYVVDLIGNCSVIVEDSVVVYPPSSRYYPNDDIQLKRRNHRFRGPRESWKQLAMSGEITHDIDEVLARGSNQAMQNIQDTTEGMNEKLRKLYSTVEHLRIQRGIV